jgi:hypothetical protein
MLSLVPRSAVGGDLIYFMAFSNVPYVFQEDSNSKSPNPEQMVRKEGALKRYLDNKLEVRHARFIVECSLEGARYGKEGGERQEMGDRWERREK